MFAFDYDLTMMIFFLDPREKVYARYGGRCERGPDRRQSLAGLRYTMQSVLNEHAAEKKRFAELVNAVRETTDKVYILPTNAAMTEAAKRFNRGELPGVQGLFKVIGGKEFSIWRDQRGHLGPGFERLEGYVFYATIYGKSPELISEPIKFSSWNSNPSFLSDELDKIFREIAWKAVVEHPLSGVVDENRNGIGDHLE